MYTVCCKSSCACQLISINKHVDDDDDDDDDDDARLCSVIS